MNWQQSLKRCTGFLVQNHIDIAHKELLLAVSGGMDSMFMLALLREITPRVTVAHVNYGLRGMQSDADAQLVQSVCRDGNIRLLEKNIDLTAESSGSNESLQQQGRRLRYEWFRELCQTHGFDFICTAHQQDDSTETFFINVIRGTGLKGLTGIPVIRDNIIRPILCFTRAEIVELVQQENIQYRHDASNSGRMYLRNRIRHGIVPLFQKERPGFTSRMYTTQRRLSEEYKLLNSYLETVKNQLCTHHREVVLQIDRAGLINTASPVTVLHYLLQEYGFSFLQCEHMLDSVKISGQQYLSASFKVLVERTRICVIPNRADDKTVAVSLDQEGSYVLSNAVLEFRTENRPLRFTESSDVEYVDASKVTDVLRLRHWRPGDYFYPLGGPGRQKLQDYFTNEKISVLDKDRIWLLTMNDEIVWVVGMRLDERFKVTDETDRVMRLAIHPVEG